MEFINFGYNWQNADVFIDLNSYRVRSHLAALIRGGGSSTESLVVDFVNDTYDSVSKYDSVQDAWGRLDVEQQILVAGFRSLMSRPVLGVPSPTFPASSPDFPNLWFKNVVAGEFQRLRDEYDASHNHFEETPISILIEFARVAEATIKQDITTTDPGAVWFVDQYGDEET